MHRSSPTCVDANLVVRLVTDHPSEESRRLWARGRRERQELVAPVLLRYEVTNALHRLQRAGDMTDAETGRAILAALSVPIRLTNDEGDHASVLAFAARFSLPAAYDAHYLALADRLSVDFWTSDRKLANAVRPALTWVHLVEE